MTQQFGLCFDLCCTLCSELLVMLYYSWDPWLLRCSGFFARPVAIAFWVVAMVFWAIARVVAMLLRPVAIKLWEVATVVALVF